MKKWMMALGCLLMLAAPAARAQETVLWTQDGYRVVARNAAGEALLLSEAREAGADGLVENIGVMFTVLASGREGAVKWSSLTSGDGNDKLEQAVSAGDGWLVAGSTSSTNLTDNWHEGWYDTLERKTDAWLIRLGPGGETLWSRTYGGSDWDSFHAVTHAHDGGFVAVGNTYSKDGDVRGWHDSGEMFIQPDGWAVCVDAQGAIVWQLTVGGSGYDELLGVHQTPEGYIAVGITDSADGDVSGGHGDRDGWAVFIGKDGTLLDQKCYGGRSEDKFVTLAPGADGYLAVGTSWSFPEGDAREETGWAVYLDGAGEVLWTQRFGGKGIEYPDRAVRVTDYWNVAGHSVYGEAETPWVISIPEWGGTWRLREGTL